MIKAEILLDSVNPVGDRLTTFVLTYPRFVHAEFMTHRSISKNSASSRAIPSQKMIDDVLTSPAGPVFWGKNQSGMQASVELEGGALTAAREVWLNGMKDAVATAEKLSRLGVHKQIANRVLEPWFHIRVVASATDWENFFFLRCHPAAQPEIQALADAMLYQYVKNKPVPRKEGEWHMPYTDCQAEIDAEEHEGGEARP